MLEWSNKMVLALTGTQTISEDRWNGPMERSNGTVQWNGNVPTFEMLPDISLLYIIVSTVKRQCISGADGGVKNVI